MGGSRSAGSKPTCGHATAFPSRCDAQCLMTPAKYVAGVLHCSIPLQFASSDGSATHTQLVDDAVTADRGAIDLYQFTRQLNDVLDDEGRRRVVIMMWEVAYVDESMNEVASNIIWRVADLLGVPSRQRNELRQRVALSRTIRAEQANYKSVGISAPSCSTN